ncbi:glycoside hydrolase family 61 protein [Lentinula detonsa]|uniref:AA9 family lytic polysaccharide monooxygenase n=1 Tax=Lentinula detonsa TaxID=2804962 RepID=A0A9W8P7V2_9AGAR|nr:glycoside hydrolase family 61 protein [Lentinula detonsa]
MHFVLAFASLSAAILRLPQVSAHGGVLSYKFGDTTYQGFVPYNTPVGQSSIQREWDTVRISNNLSNVLSPHLPLPLHPTDASLSCNIDGATLAEQLSATVAAGTQVTAYWNAWPHTIGPVMVYMAACPSGCSNADTSTLEFFKIDQAGLISGTLVTGLWGMGELVQNNNSWTSTIPASLAPGEYMIRHELLAIHTSDQPQFYPECAQLIITGSGTSTPASSYLVTFPGAYSASDPGVTIDIYANENETNYTIPGPAVWSG